MTTFEPILGGGFDAIAAQRFGYGQQNLATETANVNRFAQAQAAADAKARDIAQWNQRNSDAQYAADQAEQKSADYQNRFNADLGLRREQIAADERTATRAKDEESKRTASNLAGISERQRLAQMKQDAKLNAEGTYYAQKYGQIDTPRQAATNAYTKLSDQVSNYDSQLAAYKDRTDLTPEEAANRTLITRKKAELLPLVKQAEKVKATHDSVYNRLLNSMTPKGYDIDPDTGAIIHVESKKSWNYRPTGNRFALPNQPTVTPKQSDANASMTGTADPLDAIYGAAPTEPVTMNRFNPTPAPMSVAAPIAPQAEAVQQPDFQAAAAPSTAYKVGKLRVTEN